MMRQRTTTTRAIAALLAGSVLLATVGRSAPPSPALPKELDARTQQRIELGLRYLARTQRHDGSWLNSGGFGSYPVVMTSLAGLAFLAGGSTPQSGPYSRQVSRALDFVLNAAETSGMKEGGKILISAGGNESRSMYGHGFGMLFLAECYGMEGEAISKRGQRIKRILDGAVALTAAAQSDLGAALKHAGGWIYTPNGKRDEGSVTVTQLQALRACRNVGIKVPAETIDRAVLYLQACQQPDGGICYSYRSRGRSMPAISAAAIACFYAAGVYDIRTGGSGAEAKMVERLVNYCKQHVRVDQRSGHYFYTHFYMAQAMYQRGGEDWRAYFPQIRQRLAQLQLPDGNWNGDSIGEVYGTAIACLILQLPYGYLPIMQR